jgi:hypothetical protein
MKPEYEEAAEYLKDTNVSMMVYVTGKEGYLVSCPTEMFLPYLTLNPLNQRAAGGCLN